jgi:hypothetical protein
MLRPIARGDRLQGGWLGAAAASSGAPAGSALGLPTTPSQQPAVTRQGLRSRRPEMRVVAVRATWLDGTARNIPGPHAPPALLPRQRTVRHGLAARRRAAPQAHQLLPPSSGLRQGMQAAASLATARSWSGRGGSGGRRVCARSQGSGNGWFETGREQRAFTLAATMLAEWVVTGEREMC